MKFEKKMSLKIFYTLVNAVSHVNFLFIFFIYNIIFLYILRTGLEVLSLNLKKKIKLHIFSCIKQPQLNAKKSDKSPFHIYSVTNIF